MLHQNKSHSFPCVTQIRSRNTSICFLMNWGLLASMLKNYSTVITGSCSHSMFYEFSVVVLSVCYVSIIAFGFCETKNILMQHA